MAKGFVRKALLNPPEGFNDIVDWLYCARSGPRLLDRIISECQNVSWGIATNFQCKAPEDVVSPCDNHSRISEKSWAAWTGRLSTGAKITLNRHIEWLIQNNHENGHETITA